MLQPWCKRGYGFHRSLIIDVAVASVAHEGIFLSGVTGLVAWEYVSVNSESDTEKAGLTLKRESLEENVRMKKNNSL